MPTLRPMSTFVTIAVGSACTRTADGLHASASPAVPGPPGSLWSGQRMPTGATLMQSTQIGRPHSEHERPVSRSGWR